MLKGLASSFGHAESVAHYTLTLGALPEADRERTLRPLLVHCHLRSGSFFRGSSGTGFSLSDFDFNAPKTKTKT
jgi:hypothetical protein